ncbi:hypothetical protein F2P81_017412 [Scophthalmus maximus]|uniref:Uncharacterized protein n=1 Tax=Scophthalmus maximus TaxID=52904 RepID=A0A6A4SHQ1_SCOMX|nr:hypothetical protein F2P81_017412 [Scophthalmus maximus]
MGCRRGPRGDDTHANAAPPAQTPQSTEIHSPREGTLMGGPVEMNPPPPPPSLSLRALPSQCELIKLHRPPRRSDEELQTCSVSANVHAFFTGRASNWQTPQSDMMQHE